MNILITCSLDDRGNTIIIDSEKMMLLQSRFHCIESHIQATVSSIFKTDRHRQTTCHFTVCLRFSCTCSDCAPGNQICHILWCDRIKSFSSARQAEIVDFQQNPTRKLYSFIYFVASVKFRIIDQAFPADRRPWFFKIDTHHNQNCVRNFSSKFLQT